MLQQCFVYMCTKTQRQTFVTREKNCPWLYMHFVLGNHDRFTESTGLSVFPRGRVQRTQSQACCLFETQLQPTTHPLPQHVRLFSYANFLQGSLCGPIWRPSSGTCGAPDRCMLPWCLSVCFSGDKKTCYYRVFCRATERYSALPFCAITYPHTPNPPPNPHTHTPSWVTMLAPLVWSLFVIFQCWENV